MCAESARPDLVIRVDQLADVGEESSEKGKLTFLQIKLGTSVGGSFVPVGGPFYNPFHNHRQFDLSIESPCDDLWHSQLGAHARLNAGWQEQVDYVRTYGERLWNFLPQQFQQFYWDVMRGREWSILFYSDAIHFPWEFVWPRTRDGQQTGPEELFGISFSIGRWPQNPKFTLSETSLPSRWDAFAYDWLTENEGKPDIDSLVRYFHSAKVFPDEPKEHVQTLLSRSQSRAIYFRTHGLFGNYNPVIKLGSEEMTPSELNGLGAKLSGALVFMNACMSAVSRPKNAAEIGWPWVLLEAECAAFIGVYFDVNPRVAEKAADCIFSQLKAGQTIGCSVREVRRKFVDALGIKFKMKPDFLAYTLIGNPQQRLNLEIEPC